MSTKLQIFTKKYLKKELSDIKPGDSVRVYQKIPVSAETATSKKESSKAGGKEKFQIFEGIVIAKKHGKEAGATITVRKIISGIGVERIFPIHSPTVEKIEIIHRGKARRAKLYYLRKLKGKKAKLKKKEFIEVIPEEKQSEEIEEEKIKTLEK